CCTLPPTVLVQEDKARGLGVRCIQYGWLFKYETLRRSCGSAGTDCFMCSGRHDHCARAASCRASTFIELVGCVYRAAGVSAWANCSFRAMHSTDSTRPRIVVG